MAKKDCPAGSRRDPLLTICISSSSGPGPAKEVTPAVAVRLKPASPAAQDSSAVALSPALWTFVGLATVGSVLVLALWFFIYRQQTRLSSSSEDAEPGQEPLQKTEPPSTVDAQGSESNDQAGMLQGAAGIPSPCPRRPLGDQTSSKWEEGFTAHRGPSGPAWVGGCGGLDACSMIREHRIPLPATELGGTALVTTKTV